MEVVICRPGFTARPLRFGVLLTVLVLFPGTLFCRSPQQSPTPSEQGSALRGEALFTGAVGLRNGGPPCVTCHSVSGLPFPGGGSLGPDLSRAYRKLGSQGTDAALQTLFFNAMTPIYDPRPLTPDERADLKAYLREAGTRPASSPATPVILAITLGGFLILIFVTQFLWRSRIGSVRRDLVRRASGTRGAR